MAEEFHNQQRTMKIAGVSIWIWTAGVIVLSGAALLALPMISAAARPMPLEIVKDAIWASKIDAEIRGQIYNPRKTPARNVTVTYDLTVTNVETKEKKKVESAVASIRYIPAGGSVDFTATNSYRIRQWDFLEKGAAAIREAGE